MPIQLTKKSVDSLVAKAVDWSWNVRYPDGSWGRSGGTPRAVIDSAELLYGLQHVKADAKKLGESTDWLRGQFRLTYKKWIRSPHAARTYAWLMLTFVQAGDKKNTRDIKALHKLLAEFKEPKKGWKASGAELHGRMEVSKGNKSNVY